MKTVLLTWELGSGLGHVGGLAQVARALAMRGHRPVLALREGVQARALLEHDGFPILQAPVLPTDLLPTSTPRGASSYADILAVYGFGDPDTLWPMLLAWQELFDLVRPDLVIADHSPTACLAAHGQLPVAVMGNGFTVPPAQLPEFPALQSAVPPLRPQAELLEVVQAVQRRRGRPAPETLPAFLNGAFRAIFSFPELDPYRGLRAEPLLGPLEPPPEPSLISFEGSLFAYLAADYEAIEDVCVALAGLEMPAAIYLRGAAGSLTGFLRTRGVKVYDAPPPLAKVVPTASVVLSHGGSATAHAALAAGRPQILLPRHLEASLTAHALKNLGVATVPTSMDNGTLEWAVNHTVEDLAKRDYAQRCAEAIHARGCPDALGILINRCEELLG